MKPSPKLLLCITGSLCFSCFTHAQILKDISNRVKQKTEQRANQKIDQTIDKGLDQVDKSALRRGTRIRAVKSSLRPANKDTGSWCVSQEGLSLNISRIFQTILPVNMM